MKRIVHKKLVEYAITVNQSSIYRPEFKQITQTLVDQCLTTSFSFKKHFSGPIMLPLLDRKNGLNRLKLHLF